MSPLESFSQYITQAIRKGLPSGVAHRLMLPLHGEDAESRIKPNSAPSDAKHSAVLIALCASSTEKEISVILTIRSGSLKSHSGQISLPGGRIEKGETPEESALREAYEEINLDRSVVTTIGTLSQIYVPPSNSLISPIVGIIENKEIVLRPQPTEVEEIFFVPLHAINRESIKIGVRDSSTGLKFKAPYWDVHPRVPLWGATAMILSEVVYLYDTWLKS